MWPHTEQCKSLWRGLTSHQSFLSCTCRTPATRQGKLRNSCDHWWVLERQIDSVSWRMKLNLPKEMTVSLCLTSQTRLSGDIFPLSQFPAWNVKHSHVQISYKLLNTGFRPFASSVSIPSRIHLHLRSRPKGPVPLPTPNSIHISTQSSSLNPGLSYSSRAKLQRIQTSGRDQVWGGPAGFSHLDPIKAVCRRELNQIKKV